jgi:hypothetical protein
MRARFSISFVDDIDRYVDEDELRVDHVRYRDAILRADPLHGAVDLEEGAERVRIGDEMWYVIDFLCFDAVVALTAGKPFTYSAFAYVGERTLTPDGGVIHISAMRPMGSPAATMSADGFAQELFACGQRYLGFLEQFSNAPKIQAVIGELGRQRDRAAQALASR